MAHVGEEDVLGPGGGAGLVAGGGEFDAGRGELADPLLQGDLVGDGAAEHAQAVALQGGEAAGHAVDDAEGAEGLAGGVDERGAGVEADVGVAGDERVVVEARVVGGVLDLEDVGLEDRVGAEGDVSRGLGDVEADA